MCVISGADRLFQLRKELCSMKKFQSPDVQIVRFEAKDVLTASNAGSDDEDTPEDIGNVTAFAPAEEKENF